MKTYSDQDNYRNESRRNEQMIYGVRPVMEAVEAGKEIERIFINRKSTGEQVKELKRILQERQLSWQDVPIEKLNRLTSSNHQDVVCFISPISFAPVEEIIQACFQTGKGPLLIMLDHITDVRNFGAIARTAECCGVDALIIPSKGSAQINADAIKTSAGALNFIPVCRVDNLKSTVHYLRDSGLKVFAASEKGNKNSYEADYSNPCVIIVGSEETGISSDLIRIADDLVKIPLTGRIASLNVSVACGMILHEVLRQREGSS
jgi:23S rRNA (guanosine2251-2'-O)-methyltransferase